MACIGEKLGECLNALEKRKVVGFDNALATSGFLRMVCKDGDHNSSPNVLFLSKRP